MYKIYMYCIKCIYNVQDIYISRARDTGTLSNNEVEMLTGLFFHPLYRCLYENFEKTWGGWVVYDGVLRERL